MALFKKPLLPVLILGVLALVIFGAFFKIPSLSKSHIETLLHGAGFPYASVESISLRPNGIIANNVKLDQSGYDQIATLQADVNWPAFLTTGKISGLNIKGVTIARDTNELSTGGQQLVKTLLALPDYRVTITEAVIDISSIYGEIQMKADATITTNPDTKVRDIKANIKADQYQLGFNSTWEGTLQETGLLDLSANVLDGRINIGPLRISRFNGWVGMGAENGKYNLQGQMEAGSATFLGVPLQTLSMVNEYGENKGSMIFRSGVSGIPDVLFTADFTNTENNPVFTAILRGKHLGNLLDYVEEATGKPKNIRDALIKAEDFELTCNFQPERRFVGGPLPFGIDLKIAGAKTLDGTFLFYPDTFDIRGSMETNPEMATALQDYFKIPAKNMSQNFIRLDGNIKQLFQLEKITTSDEATKN